MNGRMDNWIGADKPPIKPGEPSPRFYVQAQEFGQAPIHVVARCFVSSLHPDRAVWMYDPEFYSHDRPHYIAEQVQWYIRLPDTAPFVNLFVEVTQTERRSKYNARRTDEYAEAITINLPYPIVPYVRMTRRGKFTSEAAQRYLANQDNLKLFMRVDRMLPPRIPLAVDISVTVPQSVGHRCDLDNLLKAILDAGRGILYADDRWIDSIVIDRRIGKDWITKIHIRTEEA